ncbi:arginine deiminase, partial [Enterorhabdus mucosicola]
MQGVNVKSEIGNLKKVILHRPGNELLNLTPNTLEELLFDDIPFLEVAQAEHDAFADILRNEGVEVVYLEDLMAEALDTDPALREQFLDQWIYEAGIRTGLYTDIIKDYINSEYAGTKDMVMKTMAGINLQELPQQHTNLLVDMVSDRTKLVCAPMPNLYFTRDPFNMIGNGVGINRMYSTTRNRETIYGSYIFNYHPDFKDVPQYYSRENTFHVEGGDVLNINDHVLAIGISQRTEPDAIDQLAHNVFGDETSTIDTILAFNIPVSRAFMHLDTVFTQIDYDKFTIHPGIMGPLTVFEITPDGKGGTKIRERDEDLESILTEYVGQPVQLIPCGGGDRIAAEREQWNDGSNTLC